MFPLAGLVASLETLPGTTLGDGALVVARRQPAALLLVSSPRRPSAPSLVTSCLPSPLPRDPRDFPRPYLVTLVTS